MSEARWQGRLLGILGAAALGVGGMASAGGPPSAEQAKTKDDHAAKSGTGGSGQAGSEEAGNPDSGHKTFTGAQDVGGQKPGTSAKTRGSLVGAEQLSVQPTGTGGSGNAMVDASEVKVPGGRDRARPELTVALEFGLDSYTGGLGGVMMNGIGYGIRVGTRFWENIGLELGYSGSRNGVERQYAPQNGAAVYRNAGDVVLTGGRTFGSGLRPYGGVGFGLGWISPNGFASETFNHDFITEIPLVAGIDYQLGPVSVGLRGTWRFIAGESFADEAAGRDVNGNMLGVNLTLGGRF